MPNLSETVRVLCEQVLGVPVIKVKQTDDPKVGLALVGGGFGAWLNLITGQRVEDDAAPTIAGERPAVRPMAGSAWAVFQQHQLGGAWHRPGSVAVPDDSGEPAHSLAEPDEDDVPAPAPRKRGRPKKETGELKEPRRSKKGPEAGGE